MRFDAQRKAAGGTYSEPVERLRLRSIYLETREVNGQRQCAVVLERKTSQLLPRTWRVLGILEDAGLTVTVRVRDKNGQPVDLTVEEFIRTGIHAVRQPSANYRNIENERWRLGVLRKQFAATNDRVRQETLARQIALKTDLLEKAASVKARQTEELSLAMLERLVAEAEDVC